MLYRPEQPGQGPARGRSRDDWDDDPASDGYSDFATGDVLPADLAAADQHWAGHDDRDQAGGWQSRLDPGGRVAGYDGDSRRRGDPGARHEDDVSERRRAELFGQLTIYTLIEDRVDEFDHLTERVVGQVRNREPDTLVFIAHAVPSAPAQRILYQIYRSRAAYQKHLNQPYIQQFDVDRRPYVVATNVVELGLQQAKVSAFPFPSVAELFPEPGYDTSGFERPDYLRDYGRTSSHPGGSAREFR